jgi:hypothetical protein
VKRGPKLTQIAGWIEESNWRELQIYFGYDVRGVMFEMQEFARNYYPRRDDVNLRVAYALLVLKGMSGKAGYRNQVKDNECK